MIIEHRIRSTGQLAESPFSEDDTECRTHSPHATVTVRSGEEIAEEDQMPLKGLAGATVRAVDGASKKSERLIEIVALNFSDTYKPEGLGWEERFAKDAFNKSITRAANSDSPNEQITILYNHRFDNILATTMPGSENRAEFRVDNEGLKATVKLADTTLGRDTYELIRSGTINNASVGFTPEVESVDRSGGKIRYTIKQARLNEVSIVNRPAYEMSDVKVKGRGAERGVEDHLSVFTQTHNNDKSMLGLPEDNMKSLQNQPEQEEQIEPSWLSALAPVKEQGDK